VLVAKRAAWKGEATKNKRLEKSEAPFLSKALFELLENSYNLSPSIFKYELPKAIKV
jgi:hypothetical protein